VLQSVVPSPVKPNQTTYRAANLLDLPKLQNLLDCFSGATGLAAALVELDGKVIAGASFQPACTHFHRVHPKTKENCIESDAKLSTQPPDGKRYQAYKCQIGMVDMSAPITVNGHHIANLLTGQFFTSEPDMAAMRARAKRLNFDEDDYINAIAQVPVYNEADIITKIDFLVAMAEAFGEMSAQQQIIQQANRQTERVNEDLRQSLEKFYAMAPVGIAKANLNTGLLLEANDAFCTMVGYSQQALQAINYIDLIDKSFIPNTETFLANLPDQGIFGPRETFLLRRDGTRREVLLKGVKFISEDGDPTFWTVFQDISEYKAMQADLLQQKNRAEAASIAKSNFLANMSHELRTPLNSIIGFSDLTMHQMVGPVPDRYRDYASLIHQSGRLLLAHINNILDLSKIEAGKLDVVPETCTLAGLLQDVVDILSVQASQKGLQFTKQVPEDHIITVDRHLMTDVLFNLIGNAIKFTEHGGITLKSELLDNHVRLNIEDSGIGMTEKQLHKALQPFGQVHDTPSLRGSGGTGLGLTLAHKILDLHGGNMDISSAPGEGTRISIDIPRAAPS